jgi:hypothetical protein
VPKGLILTVENVDGTKSKAKTWDLGSFVHSGMDITIYVVPTEQEGYFTSIFSLYILKGGS